MTAIPQAAVVDDAVRELLAALSELVREHPDPSGVDAHAVLDRVTVALKRARGRVRRAEKAAEPPAAPPARPVVLDVIAQPPPRPLVSRPGPPIPRPAPDTTRTGERTQRPAVDTPGDRPPEGTMTQQPEHQRLIGPSPDQHPPAPPAPPRRRWVLIGAAVAVLVVAIAVAATMLGGSRFTVTGTLTLPASGASHNGRGCQGSGGYSDIREGAAVTIYDAAGTIVASGHLEAGHAPEGSSLACVLPFAVADVPGGGDFYSVEVAHRGRVNYPADRLREPVTLRLGS